MCKAIQLTGISMFTIIITIIIYVNIIIKMTIILMIWLIYLELGACEHLEEELE
jgi:hypothetical protein